MTLTHSTTCQSHRAERLSFRSAINILRSRRQLNTLSDAQLRDIGITRTQAEAEAARPVWDAPASWKR